MRTMMNDKAMEKVNGGRWMTVAGTKHYLALRNEASYDARNEIQKLYNGQQVNTIRENGTYWLVETPEGRIGYVNRRFLK